MGSASSVGIVSSNLYPSEDRAENSIYGSSFTINEANQAEISNSFDCNRPHRIAHFQDASWSEIACTLDESGDKVQRAVDKSWRKILLMNSVENGQQIGGISKFLHEFVLRLQADNTNAKFESWLRLLLIGNKAMSVMLHMVRFVIRVDPSKPKVRTVGALHCNFLSMHCTVCRSLPNSITFLYAESNLYQRDD